MIYLDPEEDFQEYSFTDVSKINSDIELLAQKISDLTDRVKENEEILASDSIEKSQGTFDTIKSRVANISTQLTSLNATIDSLVSEEIKANKANIDTIQTTLLTVAGEISALRMTIGQIISDEVQAGILNVQNASIIESTINSLTSAVINATRIVGVNGEFENLSVNNFNTPHLSLSNLEAEEASIEEASIEKVEINKENVAKSTVEELKTPSHGFIFDPESFITIQPVSPNPIWVKVPGFSSGEYRLELRDKLSEEDEVIWSAILENNENTPILRYSKSGSNNINNVYYDTVTNEWWLETYARGKLYYYSSSAENYHAPSTHDELGIDLSVTQVFKYKAESPNHVVIMGDHSARYGMEVQGILYADIIKSKGVQVGVNYYGNSWSKLKDCMRGNFEYEFPDNTKGYCESEVAGYIWHYNKDATIPDETYRDFDKKDCESLEKVKWDGSKVTLVIDTDFGQDEITIDDEEQDDELPFIISFMTVTTGMDAFANSDIFQGVEE